MRTIIAAAIVLVSSGGLAAAQQRGWDRIYQENSPVQPSPLYQPSPNLSGRAGDWTTRPNVNPYSGRPAERGPMQSGPREWGHQGFVNPYEPIVNPYSGRPRR